MGAVGLALLVAAAPLVAQDRRVQLLPGLIVQQPPVSPTTSTASTPPAYVDDSQEAQDLIARAQDFLDSGRLSDAAQRFQAVIESHANKLVERGPGIYGDVVAVVTARLRGNAKLAAEYQRIFEPTASGRLSRAAGTSDLIDILTLYELTPSGLTAGLRLAGIYLAAGTPMDAAAVLDRLASHPTLGTDVSLKRRWQYLRGAAAVYGGEDQAAEALITELRRVGHVQESQQLQGWREARVRVPGGVVWNPLSATPIAALPTKLGQPLWELPVVITSPQVPNALPGARPMMVGREDVSQFEPIPSGWADRVFIHHGTEVRAVDRTSGRLLWRYEPKSPENVVDDRWMRMVIATPDQRGVAVEEERLYAVMAAPISQQMPYRPNVPLGTQLVGVSTRDGAELWRLGIAELGEALASGSFYGTPVARDGRVYAFVRRAQMGGFHAAFVIAVDGVTGKPLWKRYLASAAMGHRSISRPMSQMTLDGWRLLVADHLATVACLDARDGTMLWLHVLPIPTQNEEMADMQARQTRMSTGLLPVASPPIVTPSGVVVSAVTGQGSRRLLDLSTGAMLRPLDAPGWADAIYMLPAGGDVLSVGQTVTRLFDGATLKEKWSVPLPAPRGRAAVMSDRVVIPTQTRAVALAMASGEAVWQQPYDKPGGVLVMPDQIVFSDGQSVRSHMTWERAYEGLRAEMRAKPGDAKSGLALADLAMRSRQPEAALEGVDAALAAIAGKPEDAESRAEVFRQVMGFAENEANDSALRYKLYDRVAGVAAGPNEEMMYQISRGVFLASMGNASGAVDHFQTVLSDPTMSALPLKRGGTVRQAGVEAKLQLTEVVKKSGAKVYERYEAMAAQRFAELAPRGLETVAPGNAKALMELAAQYPMATTAPMAIAAAGEAMAAGNNPGGALIHLISAYAQVSDPRALARIGGRVVEVSLAQGHARQARRWLERMRRERPDLKPLRGGVAIDAEQWLKEIDAMPGGRLDRPRITAPLQRVEVLQGRLLAPQTHTEEGWPRDRVVLLNQGQVELRSGDELKVQWTAAVGPGPVELLELTPQRVVIWRPATGRLRAFNGQTGESLWPDVAAEQAFEPPEQAERARDAKEIARLQHERMQARVQMRANLAQQQQFVVQNGQVVHIVDGMVVQGGIAATPAFNGPADRLVRSNEEVICIAEGSGRVVAIDRLTGKPLWRVRAPTPQLTQFEMGENWIALAGVTMANSGKPASVVLVLDPATGNTKLALNEELPPPAWLAVTEEGLLLRLGRSEVIANAITDGSIRWRVPLNTTGGAAAAFQGEGTLLVQESDACVVVIASDTGQVVRRVGVPSWGPMNTGVVGRRQSPGSRARLQEVDRVAHFLSPAGATAIGLDGSVHWQDALAAQDKVFLLQAAAENTLVALAMTPTDEARRLGVGGFDVLRGQFMAMEQRAVRREQIRGQPNDPAAADALELQLAAQVAPPSPNGWGYTLYLFDRDTGSLRQARSLGPIRQPLNIDTIILLDGRVLLTTDRATLVIHGGR